MMIVGAQLLAKKLMYATLIGMLAVPILHAVKAQLPVPIQVLVTVIGACLMIGAVVRVLAGRRHRVITSMAMRTLLILCRSSLMWTMLAGASVAIFIWS